MENIYIYSVGIDPFSSNTSYTYNVAWLNPDYGNGAVNVTFTGYKNPYEINAAIRAAIVLFMWTFYAAVVDPKNIYFPMAEQTPVPKVISYPTCALNTAYQVTTETEIGITGSVNTSLTLTAGASGALIFETADDSGFTLNVEEVGRIQSGLTGSLAVLFNVSNLNGATITGTVSALKHWRVRSATATGTPTYSLIKVRYAA